MFGNRGKMRLALHNSQTLTRLRHFVSPFILCVGCGATARYSSTPHNNSGTLKNAMTINSSQNRDSPAKESNESQTKSERYILERNKIESER